MTRPDRPTRTLIAGLAMLLVVPAALRAGTLQLSASAAFAGSQGLEVTVFPGCTGDRDVSIGPGPFQGSVQACRFIDLTDVQIVSPGADLLAGRSINAISTFSVDDTDFGASLDPALDPFAYVFDESPAGESNYDASFALRLDGLTLGSDDRLEHFNGYSAGGIPWFRVVVTNTGGQKRLLIAARTDAGTDIESPELLVPAGWNQIDVRWEASSSSTVQLLINGIATQLTGVNNTSARIDFVRWGAVDGSVGATSGALELDEFTSSR